jgi:hypothetical protein
VIHPHLHASPSCPALPAFPPPRSRPRVQFPAATVSASTGPPPARRGRPRKGFQPCPPGAPPCRSAPRRGRDPFSRSAVLHRALRQLEILLERSDPATTGRLNGTLYALVLLSLPAPWTLTPFEIEHLPRLIERVPGIADDLEAAGFSPALALARLEALTYAEKVALIDAAVRQQTAADRAEAAAAAR